MYKTGSYADLARAERTKIMVAQDAQAKAEADARAKAEADGRAKAAALEQERREAEAKAARDAAIKAAHDAVATEKARREAEAKVAQEALEKAERETIAARQAVKAAQVAAEKSARELQEALEKAKQDAATQAKKQIEIATLTPGETQPAAVLSSTDIVRLMKLQLRQAGCNPGNDSGIWDKDARRALEEFNVHARMHVDINTPEFSMPSRRSRTRKGAFVRWFAEAGRGKTATGALPSNLNPTTKVPSRSGALREVQVSRT